MLLEPLFRYSLSAANQLPCYRGGPATLVCKAVVEETSDLAQPAQKKKTQVRSLSSGIKDGAMSVSVK